MESAYLKIKSILLISLVGLLCSCVSTKVVFTPEIKEQNSFTEKELKRIQFYTSDAIILYCSKNLGNSFIQHGMILLNDSKQYERIVIPKNTPCVIEKVINEDKFALSFEYGEDRILYFTSVGNNKYSLSAKNWKNGIGQIKYANKHYYTNSGTVVLTVKLRKLNQIIGREKTLAGRTVY